jgi:hypothetical protein
MFEPSTLLAAIAMVPTRFAGRAALEKLARGGDFVALRDLAGRLGLAPPLADDLPLAEAFVTIGAALQNLAERGRRQRLHEARVRKEMLENWDVKASVDLAIAFWAQATGAQRTEALERAKRRDKDYSRRGELHGAWSYDTLLGLARRLKDIHPLAEKRVVPRDPLAERRPGQAAQLYTAAKENLVGSVLEALGPWLESARLAQEASAAGTTSEAVQEALRAAYEAARFRRTAHAHTTVLTVVGRGHEAIASSAGSTWSNRAGMSRAYCRKAHKVATSEHCIRGSVAILDPEVVALNAEAPVGVLYLRTDMRVVHGRGTQLRVERLRTNAGLRGWR